MLISSFVEKKSLMQFICKIQSTEMPSSVNIQRLDARKLALFLRPQAAITLPISSSACFCLVWSGNGCTSFVNLFRLFSRLFPEAPSTDDPRSGIESLLFLRRMLSLLPIERSERADRMLPTSDSGEKPWKSGRQDGRQAPITPIQGSIEVQMRR